MNVYKIKRRIFTFLLSVLLLLPLLSAVPASAAEAGFSYGLIPAYAGSPFAPVNGGEPYFSLSDYSGEAFEDYGELDALGRCAAVTACLGVETMPTGKRGEIGSVKPTGWQTVKYDVVEGKYLYNRCHLIGWQLSAENANRRNLITGTRYLNTAGMLPFENMTADYIKETGGHVLYRVTPVFLGDDLLARGVLMEAESVEDGGEGLSFCVFCYNVQPGIDIDYATGESRLAEEGPVPGPEPGPGKAAHIINANTGVFHLPDCASVQAMKEKNKQETDLDAASLIEAGYKPCSRCRPDLAAPQSPGENEPQPPASARLRGDADGDGAVTAADARLTLRAAVGLETYSGEQSAACDMDGDSAVTAADARLILRLAVGIAA